jgi:hypothetical protein
MERVKKTIAVIGLAALAGAISLGTFPSAQERSGCGATGSKSASHAYFETLLARADCYKAYSLRDNDQLKQYTNSRSKPQRVTYVPADDADPRRQDAAKLVVPAGKVSLGNTVRLPIGTTDGTTTLVTWDAWFGKEFRYEHTGIGNYKTFQFASPKDRIWFEVRTRFKQDAAQNARRAAKPKSRGRRDTDAAANQAGASTQGTAQGTTSPGQTAQVPPAPRETKKESPASSRGDGEIIGAVDARGYGNKGTVLGPNVQRGSPLSPQAGTFTVRAETWTRYWVLIEQRADDWDLMSLWVGDEHHDPVKIIDRLQFAVKGTVDAFWLEYNTSSKGKGAALGERVGYVRNVAMLRDVKDISSLFQRPVK